MYETCYPATRPVRSAVPTFEPVELSQARLQCSLPDAVGYHDPLLTDLVKTAREQVEKDSGLALCTGTYTFKRTTWTDSFYRDWFELSDLRPITAVTAITYVDANGDTQTWATSNYVAPTEHDVAPVVTLAYDAEWPTLRGDRNGITITATAGYASQATIPMRAKQAVLMLVGHWFLHREAVPTGTISKEIEFSYTALIESLRREVYA